MLIFFFFPPPPPTPAFFFQELLGGLLTRGGGKSIKSLKKFFNKTGGFFLKGWGEMDVFFFKKKTLKEKKVFCGKGCQKSPCIYISRHFRFSIQAKATTPSGGLVGFSISLDSLPPTSSHFIIFLLPHLDFFLGGKFFLGGNPKGRFFLNFFVFPINLFASAVCNFLTFWQGAIFVSKKQQGDSRHVYKNVLRFFLSLTLKKFLF